MGGSGSHPESGRSKMSDSGTSRQIAVAPEIKARVAVSAIRETLAEGGSLGFTREQIRHHFHAAHKERAKWPHRHEAYDEDN